MKMAELAAEVQALREEVARLREQQAAHACAAINYWPLPWYQVVYPGTCMPVTTTWFPETVCAGAAGGLTTTYMLNTAGAN